MAKKAWGSKLEPKEMKAIERALKSTARILPKAEDFEKALKSQT